MRPASLAAAALPSAITEAADTPGTTSLFSLADAKNALAIPLTETFKDSHLIHLIGQAQAILEKSTGLRFSQATGATAEYVLTYNECALSIPESDVQSVTAVKEYSADGTETTLADTNYDVRKSAGRTYVVRTDDATFSRSTDGGMSVVVEFTRGVEENSTNADLVRSGMAYLVVELYKGEGTHSEKKLMSNAAFGRVVRLLQAQKDYIG